jgi:hypothetical protein
MRLMHYSVEPTASGAIALYLNGAELAQFGTLELGELAARRLARIDQLAGRFVSLQINGKVETLRERAALSE